MNKILKKIIGADRKENTKILSIIVFRYLGAKFSNFDIYYKSNSKKEINK